MLIQLNKFGNTLSSRSAGREAWLAIQPILQEMMPNQKIEIDFGGVGVLTPSWADEFITPLMKKYTPNQVILNPSQNPSVNTTIELLEDTWQSHNSV
ncbi:MAG: STAS-like domain-containing protein [Patescibacteria group bacterium]